MKTKTQILLFLLSLLLVTSVLFTILDYNTQKQSLMIGVDDKLLMAAKMIEAILGEEYHDKISDSTSIEIDEYTDVVDLFNQLCLELDLQYLWSVLKKNESFYFTTATSPSKDVTNNDHVSFYTLYSDPASLITATESMQPTFSEFKNEYGHGKMILFPKKDALGRTFLLCSSIGTEYVYSNLNLKLKKTIFLGVVIIFFTSILSLFLSNTLAYPIVTIAGIAGKIAKGPLDEDINVKGSLEIESLSNNMNRMNNSLKKQFNELNFLNNIVIKTSENLLVENIGNNSLALINEYFSPNCAAFFISNSSSDSNTLNLLHSICNFDHISCVNLNNAHRRFAEDTFNKGQVSIEERSELFVCEKTGNQINEFIGIPIMSGTYKIGVVVLAFLGEIDFDQNTNRLLITLGQQLGVILHNAKLYQEVNDELEQRKITEVKLKQAMLEAEDANRAKSEFIANMSHEIRTPLNAVIGFSEILSKTEINEQQMGYINSIKVGGNSLLMLINDILDFSKIEAGMMNLESEPTDLSNIFNEIELIFENKFKEKGVVFSTEISKGMPGGFLLDENRLRQIFLNLVGNAIKFTKDGYVKLKADYETETVSGEINTLIFTIEDTGIGISKDAQEYIFDSFRQEDGHDIRKYGGTGLGLAICRRLTEMMGGTLSLKSEIGKGSTFIIKLKNIKQVLIEETVNKMEIENNVSIKFESNSVLIADDIESNREMLKTLLLNKGLKVIEAENGSQCIVAARKNKPKLILTDIRMPEMDGVEATKILKEDDLTKDIPIIAISATLNKDLIEGGVNKIFDEVIFKPIHINELFMVLGKYLPCKDKNDQVNEEEKQLPLSTLLQQIYVSDRKEDIIISLSEIKQQIQHISGAIRLNEILFISQNIINVANKFKIRAMEQIGKKLNSYANSFNIAKTKAIINDLSTFLDGIEDKINDNS